MSDLADPRVLFTPQPEIPHRRPADVLPADVAGRLMQAFAAALDSGQVQELRYVLQLGDEEKHFEARVAPSIDDQVVTIVRDISSRSANPPL